MTNHKKFYWVVPIKEHPDIKCKDVTAKCERGALQKFKKIWGVKGKILRIQKLTYGK